ncbi:MAG: hypothetical protein JSV82_04945 [Planctomycetota bacterium]|nr:MAG: hypothetical protein JSV82_04945 [Planctomycetota bacterium]
MKDHLFIAISVLFFVALSGIGWAIGDPVGPATVPPSSMRPGLIRSPNPIDTSTNLIITGNVRGGRHFRGVVPYHAPSSFGGTLGSSTLDSFIRYSAGSDDFGQFSGKARPYYSPTGTVTLTMPGHPGVVRPPTISLGAHAEAPDAVGALSSLPDRQVLSGTEATLTFRRLRPLAMTLNELERVISSDVDISEQRLTAQRRFWMEKLKQELEQEEETAQREKDLPGRQTRKVDKNVLQPFELEVLAEQKLQEKRLDVYEQMRQRIYELQKSLEELPAVKQAEETLEERRKTTEQEPREDLRGETSMVDELSGLDLATRAKTILGPYKSFAAFSKDKFNQNMRAAEEYLKQGKYYRAADTYSLALIYKPHDPLAYAAKSLALFTAGEYISSALFLSRALEIFPEYALFDIDIVAMVGDRDILETRVVEAEQLLQRSDAFELHFILAYIYYRMGRLERAKESINAAYEKMPEVPTVIALKKAIEDSI